MDAALWRSNRVGKRVEIELVTAVRKQCDFDVYLFAQLTEGDGLAEQRLGAGRARKEDPVQAGAGVLCLAKPGDVVAEGQPLLELHTDTPDAVEGALQALEGAYSVSESAPGRSPLVIDTIRG